MFLSRWLLFWVWSDRVRAVTPLHYIFWYTTVAHIRTHSVNSAFGPKSGFKNKRQARAGLWLVMSDAGRVRACKWGPFTTLRLIVVSLACANCSVIKRFKQNLVAGKPHESVAVKVLLLQRGRACNSFFPMSLSYNLHQGRTTLYTKISVVFQESYSKS